MTDNELNMKVCEALGWERVSPDLPDSWYVPDDQPWCSSSQTPNFIGNPHEPWRLMVWAKAAIDCGTSFSGWRWTASVRGFIGSDKVSPA